GTLKMEGQAPRDERPATKRLGATGLTVQLRRPDTGQNLVSAELGADGHFSISQVLPGDWQLMVTPVPPGFLKSARFGDKDVRFTTFDIGSNGDVPLNIVVSTNTATVEGEIEGDSKRAGILLAPVGPYHDFVRFY